MGETSPTQMVIHESAKYPFRTVPVSIFTISPFLIKTFFASKIFLHYFGYKLIPSYHSNYQEWKILFYKLN
jgi:hypothetical protein